MNNKDCTAAKYTVSIDVARPPEGIFNHLINDVSKFWPEEFEGESAKLNDEFVFRSGNSHYSRNKVVELVPNKKLVWLVTQSIRKTDNFDWSGTKMIFELTPGAGGTKLQFTYDGVILEHEYDRLVQVCNMVIKENLAKSLMDASYTTVIEVAKSSTDVFNCIKEVSKWWSKDFEGNSANLNDEFVICHPGRHYSKQKLIEVVPNRRIAWLVTDSKLDWLEKDKHEWTNTQMIFELMPKDDHTCLFFTHQGLIPRKECYSRCEQGWDMVIKDRLFNFITAGKTI